MPRHEYKYLVEFENGTTRWCGDPCTRDGGSVDENAAFVIDGNDLNVHEERATEFDVDGLRN